MLSPPQGHSAAGRIRSIEKSNDLIGNRTRELPACNIVSQYRIVGRLMNNESGKMWKETEVAIFETLHRNLPGETEENN
jgi:hypothetical protein